MLRRKPTRIELKLEELSEWENLIKQDQEKQKAAGDTSPTSTPAPDLDTPAQQRATREMIHQRIGFDPRPLPQPSHIPLH